ncbi:MAG: dTMP kinase [Christensenellales bacterium]
MRGWLITFEGIDGVGKSTQAQRLFQSLRERGYDVLFTREPGGTDISEKIRALLLDCANHGMNQVTEVLLYAASRAQLVGEWIKPALQQGKIIVCDRYVDSSVAYQGYGRGLLDMVEAVNRYAVQGIMPDLTFVMSASMEDTRRRLLKKEKDRMEEEDEEFFFRVKRGFDEIALKEKRVLTIDATRDKNENAAAILQSAIALIGNIS